jgi:hypothetical protein
MHEKVLLGLFLIRSQGSIKDGLEIGRGCRRGWCLRHRDSNTGMLVDKRKQRECQGKSREEQVYSPGPRPGVGPRTYKALPLVRYSKQTPSGMFDDQVYDREFCDSRDILLS